MPVLRSPLAPTHVVGDNRFTALANPSNGAAENSVWRVSVPAGSASPVHRLTREEIFVILSGRAAVSLEGHHEVAAGDVIVVPPDVDFALTVVGDAPLEALCCLPVGGQAVLAGQAPFTPPWAQ